MTIFSIINMEIYKICQGFNKNKNIKCDKKVINNSNFCGYHKNKIVQENNILVKFSYEKFLKKYNKVKSICRKKRNLNKYYFLLDKFYYENLLSINESFKEIELNNLIILDNKTWDINLLVDLWGNALCSTEMQNPLPVFPANPFTRKNIAYNDFINILRIIKINKIKIYGPLKYLLENSKKVFNNIIYNIDSYNTSKSLSQLIIKILETKYRFRLLNIKNSQDCYIGLWVPSFESKSDFEIFFDYYDKIPIQIQNYLGDIYDNPEKIQIKNLLDNYPKESTSIYNYLE